MIQDEIALWGLTDESSVAEIWNEAFNRLKAQGGRVSIATVRDGMPESRIISLQRFTDGNVYLMTSRGKAFYRQLKEHPYISAATLVEDTHHAFRLKAMVEEVTDPEPYREYAQNNPGTMRMYRFNTDLIALFKLVKGSGEIFHLYRDDMVRRLPFGFGGESCGEAVHYAITEACTGCGACFANCAEQAIAKTADGRYMIRKMDCDDCGICYTKCPLQDIALISTLK